MFIQRLRVQHLTQYQYNRPVQFHEHRLMLRPRDSHDLRLVESSITITPTAQLRWLHDVFGNSVAIASLDAESDSLVFDSTIVIDRYAQPTGDFSIEPFAQFLPFSYSVSEIPDLGRTVERHYSDPDRKVTEWARKHLNNSMGATRTEDFLLSVTAAIRNDFVYEVRHQPGVQTPIETLQRMAGSCRDFAVLMMEVVRSVGLAARFASGYLYDPAIDGGPKDTVGAGSTHAWVEVFLPGAGWIEFDPTNGAYGGHNLVRVAVAREPEQAMPISGYYKGGPEDFKGLDVKVTVNSLTHPSDNGMRESA